MEEPVSNEAQMHGNDDSLPCSDAVVPPTAASQNPTPSPLEPSTGKRKPCKKESDVWEHFEKYDLVLDLKGVDGTKRKEIEKRAKCKYCSATYASDTKKNGTSNMWKHLNKQCLQYPYRHKDKSTRNLAFDASKGFVSRKFNKDDCLDACIRMVVRDELPFSFVESEGFREFCSVACPQFNPPSRRTLGRRFLEMYTKMKEKLKVDIRSHRICLTVKEGLKRLESSIVAIRNAVKFVRSSPSRLSYFKICVETEKIECKGLVVMDVPTRWNSTYLMLDAALKFRKAFDRMGDDPDSSYLMYFKEDEGDDERIEGIEGSGKGKGKCKTNKRVGPPSDEDWEKAVTFVMFLKTFYDVTLKISASLHPTSHSTFHDLLAIEGEIRELYRYDVTIPIEERTAMDTLLNDMATSMKKKYDKYWGEIHKVNPFLMIGVVIDPRFKLRNLKHIFEEIFENDPTCERLVAQKTNEVKQLLMNMYEVYTPSGSNMGATSTSTTNESGGGTNNEIDSSLVFGGRKRKNMMEKWKKIQQESENVVITHEVDRYLLDPLESIDEEFDILGWWRINGLKYPILASIAKDVLAIPTSTIASESCFSTSGRVIDSFRSSLSPRMVEALICSQNWIRSEDISSLQYVPSIEEMEFYESIEMEMGSKTSTTKLNKTLPS